MLTSFRTYGAGAAGAEAGETVVSTKGVINPRRFKTLKRNQGPSLEEENEAALSLRLAPQPSVSEPAELSDYENEVNKLGSEIESDECPELLVFPKDDIEIQAIPRRLRTEKSTIPEDASEQAQSLFARSCIKSFASSWHVVRHNYSKYGSDYIKLQSPGAASGLPEQTYEVDALDETWVTEEEVEQTDGPADTACKKPDSSVITTIKEGWLTKTPFYDSRGFAAMTMRQFKRRWYAIRQNPDKSYVILQHKDDSSSTAKHMMSLDAVTAVLEGVQERKHGFRVVAAGREHGFIAESQEDLAAWLETLDGCVAPNARLKKLATDKAPAKKTKSTTPEKAPASPKLRWRGARQKINAVERIDSVRSSLQSSMHPELLKFANETDDGNEKKRNETRRFRIFEVCPGMNVKALQDVDDGLDFEEEELPKEFLGQLRFLVDCNDLRFRVADWMMSSIESTKRGHVEPFFCSLALFDAGRGIKVSEDFHFDINNDYLRSLLATARRHNSPNVRGGNRLRRMTRRQRRQQNQGLAGENVQSPLATGTAAKRARSLQDIAETDDGAGFDELTAAEGTAEELGPTGAKQALFSVTFPSNEMYLVLRVEKVLQAGSISSVVEPYIKTTDPKAVEKIKSQAKVFCNRLGQYRMPFAWAARPLLKNGQMDYAGEFSTFFRQERERLTDDDMVRLLQEHRLGKLRQTVVPADVLDITLKQVPNTVPGCLTSSLVPVKPFAGTLRTHSMSSSLIREIQEVVPLQVYDPHPHNYIHMSYRNMLYIYPISVKLDPQKVGMRARNITCYIHVKDSDETGTKPLQCIYSRSVGGALVHRTETAVLYHNTNPTFYDEIKVELPVHVHRKLHLLFTFCHISCEQAKGSVKRSAPPESIVGYSWLPLIIGDKVIGNEQNLAISAVLPMNYLSIPTTPLDQSSPAGARAAASPIASAAKWVDGGKALFRVNLNFLSTVLTKDPSVQMLFKFCEGYYPQTASAQDEVELCRLLRLMTNHVEISTLINFLPVLVNHLIYLAITNKEGPGDVSNLAIKVLSFIAGAVTQADRRDQLRMYIKYFFQTDRHADRLAAVHCRLTSSLCDLLKRENSVMEPMLSNLWFILDIISKSMAQYLHYSNQLKRPRKTRFPDEFLDSLTSLILILMENIVKLDTFVKQTKAAIVSVGNFLKDCLSIMDRGHVFKMVSTALSVFKNGDSIIRYNLKFNLLRTLCSHEHFMPINMPRMDEEESCDMTLSVEFSKRHFLVSLVLKEVASAMRNDPTDIRTAALSLLQDLLAKHDLDPRYGKPECRQRIAQLYWSFLLTVLENISRVNLHMLAEMMAAPAVASGLQSNTSASSLAAMASFHSSGARDGPDSSILSSTSDRQQSITSAKRKSLSFHDAAKAEAPAIGGAGTSARSESVSSNTRDTRDTRNSRDTRDTRVSSSSMPGSQVTQRTNESGDVGGDKKDRMRMRSLTFVPSAGESVMTLPVEELALQTTSTSLHSTPVAAQSASPFFMRDKLGNKETRHMLSCFLFVVRDIRKERLVQWWTQCVEKDRQSHAWKEGEVRSLSTSIMHLLAFFDVLRTSLQVFQYSGKTSIMAKASRFNMMKSQLEQTYSPSNASRPASVSLSSALRTRILASSVPGGGVTAPKNLESKVKLDANMGTESTLVVLDLVELFIGHFREKLEENTGDNPLMKRIFSIVITLLEINQSQVALTHIFASLRAFIHKFSPALFQGGQEYCAELCYQILMKCNSCVRLIRMEACVVFYLLMRCSFEFVEGSFLRVHLQSIVALSQIIADGHLSGGQDYLRRSINSVESFATRDKSTSAQFPTEVKDLTARLRNVLHATSEMKKHEDDPEVLLEQQYILAKSYSNAAQLRQTWLQSMAKLHEFYGNYSEAAHCTIHVAGIIAEYLKFKGQHPSGAADFAAITANVVKEECAMKEDLMDPTINIYTEDDYVDVLEECLFWLEKAERYEVMVDLFKLLQPYYDKQRQYEALATSFSSLATACAKVVEVEKTKRRLLGTYFRVAFFGELFGNDNGIPYIYKEPKVTRLADISLRLEEQYGSKFGQENVEVIKESSKVDVDALDIDRAYIQITFVTPYFSEKELETRLTAFERNNNLRRFVFEAPFTKSNKNRGQVGEQWVHKTILTTANTFPYVKKRIIIVEEENFDLAPIEVAIEELSRKLAELSEALQRSPPDKVNLQRVLQGVVSVTVNAGPLAYARAFLMEPELSSNPENQTAALRTVFRDLLKQCELALELNSRIIQSDQALYHEDLALKYDILARELAELLDPNVRATEGFELPVAGDDD